MERLLSYAPLFRDLELHLRAHGRLEEPAIRQQLARFRAEIAVGRLLIYRIAWKLSRGITPTAETALAKLYGTELEQRVRGLRRRCSARTRSSRWAQCAARWSRRPRAPERARSHHPRRHG